MARRVVRAVTHDSRQVQPGSLFVALPGENTDGHLFLGDAFRRGAVAALVSREPPAPIPGPCLLVPDTLAALGQLAAVHRSRFSPTVVGVTGSVGKTSTKDFTASVLATRWRVLKNEGNLNTEVGVPLTLLRLEATHQVAVIEMGMRGRGQIAYLARLARPRVGVITNVGESHLELLGSVEEVARAKGELLEALPPDGVAVVNGDDERAYHLAAGFPGRTVCFGLGERCQVRGANVEPLGEQGITFRLTLSGSAPVDIHCPVPGRHQAINALAAAAVGWVLGLTPTEIQRGLEAPGLTGMRMQLWRLGGVVVLDDSYNASPTSTRAALQALVDLPGSRHLAVLGDMLELGSRSVPGHEEVGQMAARLGLDGLVAVGPLSRHTARAAEAEGLPRDRIYRAEDAGAAEKMLVGMVREGDVVLVKGSRAMSLERVVRALKGARL